MLRKEVGRQLGREGTNRGGLLKRRSREVAHQPRCGPKTYDQ